MAVDNVNNNPPNNNGVNNDPNDLPRPARIDNLLQGGHEGYLDNLDCYGNDTSLNAYKTTQVVSNCVDDFADTIYRTAASGGTLVTVNGQTWDLSTAEGAYAMQNYFMHLKTAAETSAQMASVEEKMAKVVNESMGK